MAEEVHQGVDADVGVGQFGGERVGQPVDECAAGAVGVDAGAANARSTRYCRVPQVIRSPSAPTNSGAAAGQRSVPAGGGAPLAVAGNRVARLSR